MVLLVELGKVVKEDGEGLAHVGGSLHRRLKVEEDEVNHNL